MEIVNSILNSLGISSEVKNFESLTQHFAWLEERPTHLRQARFYHIFRVLGFVKAFLLYFIPITFSKREITLRNFRRAFALGFFVSGVRMTDSVLATIKHEKGGENAKLTEMEAFVSNYSLGVAGFLSAFFAILIDGEFQDSIVVMLWLIFRAIRSFSPTIPHFGTFLMCIATAHILPALVFYPKYLNPGYYRFLLGAAGSGDYKALEKTLDNFKTIPGKPSACEYLHPGTACGQNAAKILSNSIPFAARLYVPMFAVSMLFSHRRSLAVFIKQVFQSTDLLKRFSITKHFMGEDFSYKQLASVVWISGLTTLIETPSRRNDLSIYVFTYAMESFYRIFLEKSGFKGNSTFNTFLISLAAGVLLHHHEQQPKIVIKSLFKLSHVTPLKGNL